MEQFYVLSEQQIIGNGYIESIFECTGYGELEKWLARWHRPPYHNEKWYIGSYTIAEGRITNMRPLVEVSEFLQYRI